MDGVEYDILVRAVESSLGVPGFSCEIGVREGGSSQLIMNHSKDRIHIGIDPYGDLPYRGDENHIYTMDYTVDMQKRMLSNLYSSHPGQFMFFAMEDFEFFKRFADGVPIYRNGKKTFVNEYAFVFVDGPHCIYDVRQAFEFFKHRIPEGGVIVFDDVQFYPHMDIESAILDSGFKLLEAGQSKRSYKKTGTIQHLNRIYTQTYQGTVQDHVRQLQRLKDRGFEPKVVYDIGACVLHWTRNAKRVFPDAKYVLFDAWEPAEELYADYDYHIGVLSDRERDVTFYQNDDIPYGNSYYREIGTRVFPESTGRVKHAKPLDEIVKERGFPFPDLIKIDVQGAERDVLEGGMETLKKAKYLIIEMQHTEYNEGAPQYEETGQWLESLGWKCIAWRFASGNQHNIDADYLFENRFSEP